MFKKFFFKKCLKIGKKCLKTIKKLKKVGKRWKKVIKLCKNTLMTHPLSCSTYLLTSQVKFMWLIFSFLKIIWKH